MLDLANRAPLLTGSGRLEPLFLPARPAEVHTAHCSAGKARKLLDYQALVRP